MSQLFSRKFSRWFNITILCAVLVLGAGIFCLYFWQFSPLATRVGVPVKQPVTFSHKRHLAGTEVDCRFCHTQVETEASAGMPSTQMCMSCHAEITKDTELMTPVLESFNKKEPIAWVRVHDLPDYAYFHHGIHVQKGIACVTCHGRVDEMEVTAKAETLHMKWCLDCHRNPEIYVRPKEAACEMAWAPEETQEKLGAELVREYGIERLTDCSVCHR